MDWLAHLAVQGTLRSLLQHHSSKASVLRRSAFFMVGLIFLYAFNTCMLCVCVCACMCLSLILALLTFEWGNLTVQIG